ncbi:hypothetical protein Skr01_52940 [Sphaerisporangium krabiense]|nr:hypothetical protein Skr01_52940 [Sphaerisporangium krabiense]
MAVIGDADRLDAVQFVDLKFNADMTGFGVQSVPDHLRDRAHGVFLPCQAQKMIGFRFDVNDRHRVTIADHVRDHGVIR